MKDNENSSKIYCIYKLWGIIELPFEMLSFVQDSIMGWRILSNSSTSMFCSCANRASVSFCAFLTASSICFCCWVVRTWNNRCQTCWQFLIMKLFTVCCAFKFSSDWRIWSLKVVCWSMIWSICGWFGFGWLVTGICGVVCWSCCQIFGLNGDCCIFGWGGTPPTWLASIKKLTCLPFLR